jgi:hypothetical protein
MKKMMIAVAAMLAMACGGAEMSAPRDVSGNWVLTYNGALSGTPWSCSGPMTITQTGNQIAGTWDCYTHGPVGDPPVDGIVWQDHGTVQGTVDGDTIAIEANGVVGRAGTVALAADGKSMSGTLVFALSPELNVAMSATR